MSIEIQVMTAIKKEPVMVPVSAFATVAEVARHARELFGLEPGDIVDLQPTEGPYEAHVLPRNANMHDFISTHGYKYELILTGTGV